MRPRTTLPVSGTRGPAGREMETVGAGEDFCLEGVEVRAPAREEYRCEDWMCVPGPGLLAEEGPRAWPGRVRVGVDIFEGFGGLFLVVGECYAMRRELLGKVESDVCSAEGFRWGKIRLDGRIDKGLPT